MIAGSLDALMSVPDWSDAIESAGVALDYFPIDDVFPAMAQAVLASDDTIKNKPDAVRGVVQAILRAVRDCIADPAAAARDFVAAVPQQAGKEAEVERIVRRYASETYLTNPPAKLGYFDPARLGKVEKFYLDNDIIHSAVPVEELYSNDFIG
jgi:NitT/TauT family transport system substrate-binding protein